MPQTRPWRSVCASILLSLGTCFGSLIITGLIDPLTHEGWLFLPFLPGFILFRNAQGLVDFGEILLNFGYYIVVLFALEQYCLRHADRLLGRAGGPAAGAASLPDDAPMESAWPASGAATGRRETAST